MATDMTTHQTVSPPESPQQNSNLIIKFIMLLAGCMLIGLLLVGAYFLAKAIDADRYLLHKTVVLQNQWQQTSNELSTLHHQLNDLSGQITQTTKQMETQEALIKNWQETKQSNIKLWQLLEIEYLIRFANDLLQYEGNVSQAIILLTRADQLLQQQDHPDLLQIRKKLAENLVTLQSLPQIDVTGVYARIIALQQKISELELPALPLTRMEGAPVTMPTQSGWEQSLNQVWQSLKQVVVVKKITTDHNSPFVLPTEKPYLLQALQAQLATTIWALLHHNQFIYQESLNTTEDWLNRYFAKNAALTSVLEQIVALKTLNVAMPIINVSEILQLLDAYKVREQSGQSTAVKRSV